MRSTRGVNPNKGIPSKIDRPAPDASANPEAPAMAPDLQRIVNVPLMRMRCFGSKSCMPASLTNYFQRTAREIVNKKPDWPQHAAGVLTEYYDNYRPESAAEVLGLSPVHMLADYPALAAVLPWYGMTPGAYLKGMETGMIGYYMQNDKAEWGISDGHVQWGPVSKRKIKAEVNRYNKIIKFVSGMDNKLAGCPPILGVLVENDETGEWIFDIRDGIHRCAVFSARGFERVNAQTVPDISATVKRSEWHKWRGVVDGVFTKEEALRIFDAYVGGTL